MIELLVVVAILAVLVSILMPLLDRATELGRLTVCKANLHNYGTGAAQFTGAHDGYYPGAYHWEQGHSTIFPAIRLGTDPDWYVFDWVGGVMRHMPPGYPADGHDEFDIIVWKKQNREIRFEAWRRYGTSEDTYREYGITIESLRCPSVGGELKGFSYAGSMIFIDYLLVGGCQSDSEGDWGVDAPGWVPNSDEAYAWNDHDSVPPAAVSVRDGNLSDAVLAMDIIHYKDNNGSTEWNHASSVAEDTPGPQNVLWGDGSVTMRPDGYYKDPLDEGNYSLRTRQPANNTFEHYYYWSYRP